jgi:hypothetical protein
MIRPDKLKGAMNALNKILVRARYMACGKEPHERIAEVLDAAELLPMLVISEKDETGVFGGMLEDLARSYPDFQQAVDLFREPSVTGETT